MLRPLSGQAIELTPQQSKAMVATFLTASGFSALTALTATLMVGVKWPLFVLLGMFIPFLGIIHELNRNKRNRAGLVWLGMLALTLGILGAIAGAVWVALGAGLMAVAFAACALTARLIRDYFSSVHAFIYASTITVVVAWIITWLIEVPGLTFSLVVMGVVVLTAGLLKKAERISSGEQINHVEVLTGAALTLLKPFTFFLEKLGFSMKD